MSDIQEGDTVTLTITGVVTTVMEPEDDADDPNPSTEYIVSVQPNAIGALQCFADGRGGVTVTKP